MLKSTVQTLKAQWVLLPAVTCLVFAISSQAQNGPAHITFDVGAGFSFPLGETGRHTKTGFNFVASGGPRFNPRLSLTLDFSLHYFNIKNSLKDPVTGVDLSNGSMMRLWTLTVNPEYEFIKQERFSSYVTAGYGLYNRTLLLASTGLIPATVCDSFFDVCVKTIPVTVTGHFSPYKAGYNVGGGVIFGTHTKFFVETRYHHMFTNQATQVIPLTFGLRW